MHYYACLYWSRLDLFWKKITFWSKFASSSWFYGSTGYEYLSNRSLGCWLRNAGLSYLVLSKWWRVDNYLNILSFDSFDMMTDHVITTTNVKPIERSYAVCSYFLYLVTLNVNYHILKWDIRTFIYNITRRY